MSLSISQLSRLSQKKCFNDCKGVSQGLPNKQDCARSLVGTGAVLVDFGGLTSLAYDELMHDLMTINQGARS